MKAPTLACAAAATALSLDYANLWPTQGCDLYRPRARCMFDADSPESLFVACGECDVFFSGTRSGHCEDRSPGVTRALELLTGRTCDNAWSCAARAPGGGPPYGWVKIPGDALTDGEADHCYMFADGCLGPVDPRWLDDPQMPWNLPAIVAALRAALPPTPR